MIIEKKVLPAKNYPTVVNIAPGDAFRLSNYGGDSSIYLRVRGGYVSLRTGELWTGPSFSDQLKNRTCFPVKATVTWEELP